jgi:hypothetical protein
MLEPKFNGFRAGASLHTNAPAVLIDFKLSVMSKPEQGQKGKRAARIRSPLRTQTARCASAGSEVKTALIRSAAEE